jgi:hypothetical protein
MKKLFSAVGTFLFLFCNVFNVSAQQPFSAVKASVRANDTPLEHATITILRLRDSSTAKIALSSRDGSFAAESLKAGEYFLAVSITGYEKYLSPAFALKEGEVLDLGNLTLKEKKSSLHDVTVVARKPLVEQKIDRMVVNVEGQAASVGLNALEVLEKSPGITVDRDGNISLKGKQGVLVLIDNKPTYMSAIDLTNYLNNLPASSLESIEIMSNPPAKYDAAGNAGVINIKTKRNKASGFNGSANAGMGQGIYPKANAGLNLNYRNNRWNWFGNYSYNYNENFQDLSITRNFRDKITNDLSSIFDQQSVMKRQSFGHNGKAGADYYAGKKTTLGVVLTGFINHTDNDNENTTWIMNPQGEIQSITEAHNTLAMGSKSLGANFNFRHQFDTTGRELTADVDVIGYNNGNDQLFINQFFDKTGAVLQPDELVLGDLPSRIRIYSAKTDYVHSFKNKSKLEAGFKASYVETDNDAKYFVLNNGTGQWEVDQTRTNHFVYEEYISAAYANYSREIGKKWSLQLGLRLENTIAKGRQLTTSENFDRNYTQLFPTLFAKYAAGKNNSFVVNYGRRIQRPNYQDLNPFIYYLDRYTFQAGNPNLTPQFAHNIELTHSFKGFLNTTLNYSHTSDIISQVFRQNDATNTTFITNDNIATRQQYGISTNAGLPVNKWWRVNLFANAFYNTFEGEINGGMVETEQFSWMANLQNQFTFGKGWGAELSGFYRSRMLEGVIFAEPMGAINLAGSKKVLKNKGTIRLNLRDVFDLQYFRGSSKYQNIDIRFTNYWDNQVANLSFTYNFGKPLKGPQPRRNAGGASDEQQRVSTGNN